MPLYKNNKYFDLYIIFNNILLCQLDVLTFQLNLIENNC